MANNLISELQRQRESLVLVQQQAQTTLATVTARIAALDAILADMQRDPATTATYSAVQVDATGVAILSAAEVKAQAAPTPLADALA